MSGSDQAWRMASRWAESAWLLAALLVPVAYEPQASLHFIPIKSAMFQMAGLIAWGALGICAFGIIRTRAEATTTPILRPILLPVIAVATVLLSTALSAWLSIDQSVTDVSRTIVSFSLAARFYEVGLFLALATFLRQPEQLQRLITMLLLSSLPVALMAVMELYGVAPQHFAGKRYGLTSYAGGPIFLAGYLVMLIPLCIWKLSHSHRMDRGRPSAATGCYALLLTLQFVAFIGPEKRGPLLALMLSGMIAVFLFAWILDRWKWVKRAVVAMSAVAVVLITLALLHKSEVQLDAVPWIQKLALIVPVGAGTGDTFRDSLWESVPRLIFAPDALVLQSGENDPVDIWRPVFGYGPDTVRAVLPSQWIWLPAWPSTMLETSAHSFFWDVFLMLGSFGLFAAFWFLFEVCFAGLVAIGFRNDGFARCFTLGLCLLCGTTTGAILAAIYHAGYIGLGFSIGFILGFPIMLFVYRKSAQERLSAPAEPCWQAVAIMTGLFAHWIDIGFVFPTGNTNFLFWVFAGILVALGAWGRSRIPAPGLNTSVEQPRADLPLRFPVVLTIALPAMIVHGLFSFPDWWNGSSPELVYVIVGVVLPTCALGAIMLKETFPSAPSPHRMFLISIGGGVGYAAIKWLFTILIPECADFPPTLVEVTAFLPLAIFFISALILSASPIPIHIHGQWLRPAFFAAVGLWVFCAFNGRTLRAESLRHFGEHFLRDGDRVSALEFYQRALSINAGNAILRSHVANILLDQDDPTGAIDTIAQGVRLSRFNELSALAGDIHMKLAISTGDSQRQIRHAIHARYAYWQAMRYNPRNETAWFNASLVERHLLKNLDRADVLELGADQICARKPETEINISLTVWGTHYAEQFYASEKSPIAHYYHQRAMDYLNRAIPELQHALEKPIGSKLIRENHERNLFWSYLHRGNLRKKSGDLFAASMDYMAAEEFRPVDVNWKSGGTFDFGQLLLLKPIFSGSSQIFSDGNSPVWKFTPATAR